jgi:predicted nucleotidyltransferase
MKKEEGIRLARAKYLHCFPYSLMKHNPPTRQRGLVIARRMKEQLLGQGVPVVQVLLFGSLAQGTSHTGSDIDIAVVHRPFGKDRLEEHSRISNAREDFDVPMDIISFHPDDLENIFSTIAQEVKKHGIPV